METRYKTSQYNYMIDHKDKKLFFNGVTCAGFCMTKSEFDILYPLLSNLKEFQKTYPDDFERLKNLGYIIDEERDEIAYLKFKNLEEVFLKKDYRIFINPALECNFKCWYCYESHPKGYMTVETMEKIKKHLILKVESEKFTSINLSWFGGEPLLYFDEIIYPLAWFAKELCEKNNIPFHSSITTNGYCINNQMIEKFDEINLRDFQITLDGHRDRHNKIRNKGGEPSYDKIVKNINSLCEKIENIYLILLVNYDNQTLKQQSTEILYDIEKKNRHKVTIDLQRVWQTQNNKDNNSYAEIKTLIEKAKAEGFKQTNSSGGVPAGQFYNCYVCKFHYLVINYDGKVYKCTARDYREPYEMGNIKDDGNIVWNINRLSKPYGTSTLDNPVCLKCNYLPLCWGPCPQKMVEFKELGGKNQCVINFLERKMEDRIVDIYEGTVNILKKINKNVDA
jgi:uncharacterized protein